VLAVDRNGAEFIGNKRTNSLTHSLTNIQILNFIRGAAKM